MCHALGSLDHGLFLQVWSNVFPISGVIAVELTPPDATRRFWGMGPPRNGKKEFLWRCLSELLCGEAARLDETVEVAAIEQQSAYAWQGDPRQRPALD
jgi:hypothetical protein